MPCNITKSRTKSSAPWKVSNSKPYLPPKTNSKSKTNNKLLARDPRFSDLSGNLNVDLFRKSYEFIDQLRDEEEKILRKFVNKNAGKNTAKTANLDQFGEISVEDAKKLLNKYKSHNNVIQKKREFARLKRELKEKERAKLIASNKKAFYYSDSKIKKMIKEKNNADIPLNKLAKKEAKKAKKSIKSIPARRM